MTCSDAYFNALMRAAACLRAAEHELDRAARLNAEDWGSNESDLSALGSCTMREFAEKLEAMADAASSDELAAA